MTANESNLGHGKKLPPPTTTTTTAAADNPSGDSGGLVVPVCEEAEWMGMATFWGIVAAAVLATLVVYCWPTMDKIQRQRLALEAAETSLAVVSRENARLYAELHALDDPFFIERTLRAEFNWRPIDNRRP